jgi:hypothetical protein
VEMGRDGERIESPIFSGSVLSTIPVYASRLAARAVVTTAWCRLRFA